MAQLNVRCHADIRVYIDDTFARLKGNLFKPNRSARKAPKGEEVMSEDVVNVSEDHGVTEDNTVMRRIAYCGVLVFATAGGIATIAGMIA